HQVVRVAAIAEYAETLHGAAEIFFVAFTGRALAATNPRMREHTRADLDALGIGPHGNDFADVFMAKRDRQFHAAILQAHALAAAEVEPAIVEMQVAVANAGGDDFQQHLGACRLWRRLLPELQRLAAGTNLIHTHGLALARMILARGWKHSSRLDEGHHHSAAPAPARVSVSSTRTGRSSERSSAARTRRLAKSKAAD